MNKNTLTIVGILLAAAVGFFAGKSAFQKPDYAFDYNDCIEKCNALPQEETLKANRVACIAAVPKPNATVCLHVPPANQQACFDRVFSDYEAKIQPCWDAYDRGIKELSDCRAKCNNLISIGFKAK